MLYYLNLIYKSFLVSLCKYKLNQHYVGKYFRGRRIARLSLSTPILLWLFFPKAINTLCFLLLLSKNRMAINTLASQNRIEWTAHSKGWMGLSPSASHYIFKNFIMAAGQRDDSCLFMAAFVLSVYVYLRIRGQPVYLYEGKERRRL